MTKLTLLQGISGSGKSTYAYERAVRTGEAIVNRDSIRFKHYGVYYGPPIDERVVTVIEQGAVLSSLVRGIDVILDNTNIDHHIVNRWANFASEFGVDFEIVGVSVPLDVALKRNSRRERQVPEDVIRGQYTKLQRNIANGRYAVQPLESEIP